MILPLSALTEGLVPLIIVPPSPFYYSPNPRDLGLTFTRVSDDTTTGGPDPNPQHQTHSISLVLEVPLASPLAPAPSAPYRLFSLGVLCV